jgi:hypothetical protein
MNQSRADLGIGKESVSLGLGIRRRLHGFRHFNAVLSLRRGIGVFDVARNTASAIAGFPAGLNGNKVKRLRTLARRSGPNGDNPIAERV